MRIPDSRVGIVIGKGGATVKDLQNRTGARVQIPSQSEGGSGFRNVSISGPQQPVQDAQQQPAAVQQPAAPAQQQQQQQLAAQQQQQPAQQQQPTAQAQQPQ
ncbi:unnamed protein product, partial [Phaeothamnion confervicola]